MLSPIYYDRIGTLFLQQTGETPRYTAIVHRINFNACLDVSIGYYNNKILYHSISF